MTSPLRDAFRPTTTLGGPDSASALRVRQIVLLALCWLVWHWAAGYVLDAVIPQIAPTPAPSILP